MSADGAWSARPVLPHGRPWARRNGGFGRAWIAAAGVAGGVLVAVGALLRWLSVYAGLESYRGTAGLNGRLLVAGGALSILLALSYLWRGGGKLRWAMGVLGALLLGFCAWLVVQLLALYRDVGGNPFVVGRLGPGLFISTAGALVVLGTLLLPDRGASPRASAGAVPRSSANLVYAPLALLSGSAAVIHFGVFGEHMREYWLLGIFFVIAGAFQMGWALLAFTAPGKYLLLVGAAVNATIIVVWALSRTVGLPAAIVHEGIEPIGFPDAVATVYEAILVIGALVLLRRPGPRFGSLRVAGPIASTLALGLIFLTILALLRAVHGTGALSSL